MSKMLHSLIVVSLLGATAIVAGTSLPAVSAERAIDAFAAKAEPPGFATPEEATAAFKAALAANDFEKVANILGLDPAKAKASEGAADTFEAMREGAAKSLFTRDQGDEKIVVLGDRLWPLPFPLRKDADGKWWFDTFAGLQEILARRIGENELLTIDTMSDYIVAQLDYATEDRDGDGVLEYAQKLISTEGMRDGLYWPPELGDGEDGDSPGGIALSAADVARAKAGDGYFGYRYRVLTGQGDNIAGGQYDYIINGNMIVNFGLIAWPVKYGETGVHTFVVNREGIVYQADLGADTDRLAAGIRRFNPNKNWEIVND